LDQSRGHWVFNGALVVSLLLHTVVWAALTDRAQREMPATDQTPVLVDLVPPPEQEAAKQEAPEQEIKTPQPEPQPQAAPQPIPILQPVIKYGETDGGSRVAPDGTAAQDQAQKVETEKPDPGTDTAENGNTEIERSEGPEEEAVETATAPDQPNSSESETAADSQTDPEAGTGTETEAEADAQEAAEPQEVADAEPAPDAADSESDTADQVAILVTPKARPKPPARKRATRRRATPSRTQTGSRGSLKRAARLYSREILSDPSAQASMIGVPRSARINTLCMTEMRAQILAENPSRAPDYLPRFPRASGTVLQPRQAAFRSRGQWYDFTFRCEVDRAASRVENFSYRLGRAIPPADWARRRLPTY